MSTIREKADQYMEKHFPESDFEDLHITTDQLIDGIPQAYEDGFKDAIEEAVKWLQKYFVEDHYGMSPAGFGVFEYLFRKSMSGKL